MTLPWEAEGYTRRILPPVTKKRYHGNRRQRRAQEARDRRAVPAADPTLWDLYQAQRLVGVSTDRRVPGLPLTMVPSPGYSQ